MKITQTKREHLDLEVCVDCYFFFHYGKESFKGENDLSNEYKKNIVDSFSKIEKNKNIYNFGDKYEDQIDFSKVPCEICESQYSGSRFLMFIEYR
jgi:ribosome-binding protein aMBF1 (putative translation factor)